MRRHQHPLYSQALGERAGVHGAGSAKGHKGEWTWVEAPLQGDCAQRPLHSCVGDSEDALGCGYDVLTQLRGQHLQVEARPFRIQCHPPVQKAACVQTGQDQVGVRYRYTLAAAVAGRPRLSTGRLRAYQQRSAGIDSRY